VRSTLERPNMSASTPDAYAIYKSWIPRYGLENMPTQATTVWRLRRLMFDRNMFKTNDLMEPLREHGIELSREQVYRLVTGSPQRLNMDVLGALCSILECNATDLIGVEIVHTPIATKRTGTDSLSIDRGSEIKPVRFDVSSTP
jgi:DNA-binding Xre family transcriptional regulator